MKVTVVIPNYNGMSFLKDCMESLKNQTYKDFSVLVVDNASADGSLELLAKEYPEAEVLALDKNYGFSRAVNEGIAYAKTPYVLLLNNDTASDKDFVGELVKCMDKEERIFSANPKMIQMYKPELLDDAGDLYCVIGWGFQRGVGQKVDGYNKECNIFSACAGASIYRREVFDEIGVFDEMHFAYLEDIDVGYRARIAGYKNVYCPAAKVYHVGSGTSGSKYNDFKVKLAARNGIYLNYKNMPFLMLLMNLFPLAFGVFIKYLFFWKKGFKKAYVEGLKEGIKTCRTCKKVHFKWSNLGSYIRIEFELIINLFVYAFEFLKRKI